MVYRFRVHGFRIVGLDSVSIGFCKASLNGFVGLRFVGFQFMGLGFMGLKFV